MNASMLKALAADALYQVLDNKVFRILLVLVIVPVLGTLLFGFREDEIVFLFGAKSWSYDGLVDFMASLSGTRFGLEDPQTLVINGFSSLIVDFLAGSFGVMLTIAAASFFVPRMIEKGAADVLFHKPLSRLILYLSRYLAGVIFIALFAIALVGGMYLGFLVSSQYNDPGLLWAAVTLTYVFALIHGVSMLIGVVTRSTVAAIMLTILFFMMNGCVHQAWVGFEQHGAQEEAQRIARADAEGVSLDELEEDDEHPVLVAFRTSVAVLHYLGPKTTDGGVLTSKLRAAVEGEDAFLDPETDLVVIDVAGGLDEREPGEARAPAGAADRLGTAAFHASDGERSFTIWSRPRALVEREFAGRVRERPETAEQAADALVEALSANGAADLEREDTSIGDPFRRAGQIPMFRPRGAERVYWSSDGRPRVAILATIDDTTFTLLLQGPAGSLSPSSGDRSVDEDHDGDRVVVIESGDDDEETRWSRDVLKETGVLNRESGSDWYPQQLGWTSPLKFNLFFSIGSSIAFVIFVLLLGWWRLSRIDF